MPLRSAKMNLRIFGFQRLRLVSEMDTGFQEVLDLRRGHRGSFSFWRALPGSALGLICHRLRPPRRPPEGGTRRGRPGGVIDDEPAGSFVVRDCLVRPTNNEQRLTSWFLTLRELEALAGLRTTRLLPLHLARVARQQRLGAQAGAGTPRPPSAARGRCRDEPRRPDRGCRRRSRSRSRRTGPRVSVAASGCAADWRSTARGK